MRSFFRALLLLPTIAALIGFASVHYEERSTETQAYVRTIEIGAYEPWFVYTLEASHSSPAAFAQHLVDRMEEEGLSSTESLTTVYERTWNWEARLFSASTLAGVALLVLVYLRYRLRPRHQPLPPITVRHSGG